ncbi:glycosyltransferase family 4 protein [Aequorivita todarodis]|uniref:glycosyltransferase family 4 protein n=1 Tax=Aequorivita todarodis TaxID=2036821 RepID=UPI002350C84B|nr:glycosyltransferase family 4 protein [Aequorivita todarodis]MDC8000255.1 glycosyltransferase family 4 protein [Aequorivita todarodis]
MPKPKLIRITTVPISLEKLLDGQLAYLNKFFNVTAVSGNGPSLEEVKEREKVRVVALEMERKINPVKDILSLFQLIRFFQKEKPDIVHSITPKAGLLSMTAAYFTGVPIRIHTFTGLIFPTKKGILKKVLITMDKILCVFATNIYPEGQGVKQDLLKYNITKKPLKVLANGNINGIDTAYFDPSLYSDNDKTLLKTKWGIPQDNFLFVFVGRLVKDKGINELIAAFSKLSILNNKVSLLLVGPFENDLDPLLPSTLKTIESHSRIYSAGYQNDVRPFFAIADALVFPSYREGFPNVVMQAGAMGLPAIVTDINGCNEIIDHHVNGLIVAPKNEEELKAAMELLVMDTTLYSSLKSTSRQIIVEKYNRQEVWEALLAEYRKCVKTGL